MKWIKLEERLPESSVPVIVYVQNVNGNSTRRLRAVYAEKFTLECVPEEMDDFAEYDENTDTYWLPEGWYEWNEYEDCHFHIEATVTHWMPLPDPPIV